MSTNDINMGAHIIGSRLLVHKINDINVAYFDWHMSDGMLLY
jgi:hypothetical protein